MAYEKQNFVNFTVLTAEQLNHIEEGIEQSVSYTKQTLTEEQKAQARVNIGVDSFEYKNPNIRAVNHRGYNTEAPENTLSAFRLSKKMGYEYVECDVCFTSDGVPVLLHDSTVDRTSNGTGSIAEMTYDEVRTLDFGSWFSADYAGEKIPALAEFIILCKQNGLHPYIEIKGDITAEQAQTLVGIVKRYDMQKNVTWISFSGSSLEQIKAIDTQARLGFVVDAITESTITTAMGMKNDENEVFVDVFHGNVTSDAVTLCVENDLPLEIWTVNTVEELLARDRYVSGYTSDNLRANVVLYDAEIPLYIPDAPTGEGNLLDGVTWVAGYLSHDTISGYGQTATYGNGEITTLSHATNKEAEMVTVIPGKSYIITYRCPSASTGWWAIGEVFSDGAVPLRTTLPLTNYTVDGTCNVYVYEYTPADNVAGIHVSGRTYEFDSSISVNDANAMAASVGGNHFTMYEA